MLVFPVAPHPPFQAVSTGHAAISKMCAALTEWAAKVGKPKRAERLLPPAGLQEQFEVLAEIPVENTYR